VNSAVSRSAPLLALEGVGKSFATGTRALDAIDLTVADGEFVSILGPSGCGKSTLLRLIAGLMPPSDGRIAWPTGPPPRGGVGFVFQDPTLMPWATVFDNVYLPLRLAGVRRETARPDIEAALDRVGLAGEARRHPRALSGGMRMRVSIARALVTRPRLLLLDEPFAALDEITRFRLNDDLMALWRDQGWTVLFVTHSVFESVFLSTRIVVMSANPGRIAADMDVPLPQPRAPALRTSAAFAAACRTVSDRLAEAMVA
jgi:NitT/TauT family transport system ATP-binding protein